jgi:hypothetical protein
MKGLKLMFRCSRRSICRKAILVTLWKNRGSQRAESLPLRTLIQAWATT